MEMLIKYRKWSYTLHIGQPINLNIIKNGGREGARATNTVTFILILSPQNFRYNLVYLK